MQRIQYIEHRLLDWGEWALRQRDGGGMLRVISSIYLGKTRVQTSSDASSVQLLAGEQAETDRYVVRLGHVDQVLQQTVFEVYRDGRRYSMAINARRMRVNRNCLHERICRAQLMIDTWMRDTSPAYRANWLIA